MARTKHGLPETKGLFQIRGLVNGTMKDKFVECRPTKTGKGMYLLNFGVQTNESNIIYTGLNGIEQNKVYFYKRSKEKGQKGETKEVVWDNRKDFNEDGFKLIGVNVGIAKKINEKGKEVNDNKTLVAYDAAEYMSEHLKDDMSVFVKGNIEYSHFVRKNGEMGRNEKFTINQISLCKAPIDFNNEKFIELNDFEQVIIFMGITKDDSNKNDVKGIVSAKIVTYSSIEDAEFVVRDSTLIKDFRKNLKPYTAIKVWGKINRKVQTEEVVEDDCWGERNSFEKVSTPSVTELVVTGADPKTIDKEVYSQDKLDDAIRVLKEFGDNKPEIDTNENVNSSKGESQWGSTNKINVDDDDDTAWD